MVLSQFTLRKTFRDNSVLVVIIIFRRDILQKENLSLFHFSPRFAYILYFRKKIFAQNIPPDSMNVVLTIIPKNFRQKVLKFFAESQKKIFTIFRNNSSLKNPPGMHNEF